MKVDLTCNELAKLIIILEKESEDKREFVAQCEEVDDLQKTVEYVKKSLEAESAILAKFQKALD